MSSAAVPVTLSFQVLLPWRYQVGLQLNGPYVNACRQGSLSAGWSAQHALRSRGTLWPHCSTVRPCGVSCQPPGHVFKSCSGKVGRWCSFSTGSNCKVGNGWALQGGPGWVPAYDSQGSLCTLLHWTLPLIWRINMAGDVLVPPGNRQQQVCRLYSAVDNIRALPEWMLLLQYCCPERLLANSLHRQQLHDARL